MPEKSPPDAKPPKGDSTAKPPKGDPSAESPKGGSSTKSPKGDSSNKSPKGDPSKRLGPRSAPQAVWLLAVLALGLGFMAIQSLTQLAEIDYRFFWEQVDAKNVTTAVIRGQALYGEFKDPPLPPKLPGSEPSATPAEPLPKQFVVTIGRGGLDEGLRQKLIDGGVFFRVEQEYSLDGLITIVWLGLLIGMGVWLWSFARRTRDQMVGGGMLGGVTRSPARLYDAEEGGGKTFDDVAGLKGVKRDLQEIVEFLKEPEKFLKLGARIPKGVLLNGPPGTGKTLLAKAIAGEAGVPFFSISGSEFIQMFVGVGASRVRDMFKTAKKAAPAILFIDEIDAVGRQRGAGLGGGHDEREQTLNQILSEMDGFTPNETVIVIAATNRPDVLDPALMRPGRFDRHVTVDRPTIQGREELFEVHTKGVPIADTVDFAKLARATVGMTGADIMNLVNEAALWATRQDKAFVETDDFEYARDKILMGDAREDILTEKEKQVTAFHEAGHALLGWLVPNNNRVHKVTIIPRGRAMGVTQYVPSEDRHSMSESEIKSYLAMGMAGRAAEILVFGEHSNGASSDLKNATSMARKMVVHWGMSDRIGPVAYHTDHADPFLGRELVQEGRTHSDHTARMIDEEVTRILNEAAELADQTLTKHRDKLEALAMALLEREEIDDVDIAELIGPAIDPADSPLGPPLPTYITPDKITAAPTGPAD
ncbi:ATP-dependent zinc metalloprotease FtsH [Botrimarina colliarenosi]|uniref:ATP-dependent zinc metalloprotease FtsH n=1 Tax=Botrimarina colliarenosi TaxID=2528001 RepID=A0A5C6A782_9BACT|nr:ATP-dependent zinc metalloprotease FtsH [Botrimarina colliarenosi]TWT95296.1 ATP-dependent zinc metalloprotease FtsH [Botrimarina colliarenosi]